MVLHIFLLELLMHGTPLVLRLGHPVVEPLLHEKPLTDVPVTNEN